VARKPKFPPGSVCKPCWELKYCPYGQMIEYFPFAGDSRNAAEVEKDYQEVLFEVLSGTLKTEEDVEDAVRRLHLLSPWKYEEIRGYDPEEITCRVFGHSCPVFFLQSGATETKEGRPEGRRIPRDVMLKVVRRDNHVCQSCHRYVPDTEIEFDHVIPFSRGGPTTVENLRLLCRPCNRRKSDALSELLDDW
jgi:hypothetical protein